MVVEELLTDDPTEQGESFDLGGIVLRVASGKGPERTLYAPGPSAVVGRSATCDIPVKDSAVSRIHLKIRLGGDGWYVQDLWSRNGTRVHGKKIEAGVDVAVREGERIQIGGTVLYIETPSVPRFNGEEGDTAGAEIEGGTETLALLKAACRERPLTYLKNMELLHVMSKALMETVDLEEIFQKLVTYLFELFKRIDRAAVLQWNPETGGLDELIVKTRNGAPETEGRPYSRTIVNSVLERGTSLMMPDFDETEDDDRSDSQRFIRSVLCVPLISRSVVRGVIYVDSLATANSFRQADLFLLNALSSPAAVAIENATLVADLEQSVAHKSRALQEAEDRLRESEIRFKSIFRSMNSGAMVFKADEGGRDFRIIDVNHAARRIEEAGDRDLVGSFLSRELPFAGACGLESALRRVWESGQPESLSVSFATGKPFPSHRDYYVYRLPSDEIVALYDDTTGQKLAEKEQQELQLQLFTAQKMESIGLIAGGVAHNFRNILQAVSGNIEYLELIYGDKPEVLELTRSIYESVRKGTDLAGDLLQFSKRTEEGEESFAETDLAEVIRGAYTILSRSIDQKIEIALEVEPDLYIRANGSLLSQVFMNLFTNAHDAMPNGGTLRVEAWKEGKRVMARVSDTGTGMSADTTERIFDPFYTLKEVGKGTGLGLSTSRGIVEQHRGRIRVSSRLGEGSTFEIILPASGKGEQVAEAPPVVSRSKREEKVLIVDDDPAVLDSLANLILYLGYPVRKLTSPKEALEAYEAWQPDLVLVDRNMPEMDGPTCIRKLLDQDPSARIVIVSGYQDAGADAIDDEIRKAIRGYITKPCELSQLSEMLNQVFAA